MVHDVKTADFFLDGQNLFLSVKHTFGYSHPNFDVLRLCDALAERKGWQVGQIHFYTGMPSEQDNPHWNDYWRRRLDDLRSQGVQVFNPPLRYRTKREVGLDGIARFHVQGSEKGIDVKIALDMVSSVIRGTRHLCVLSQDNDLAVAADEVRSIGERLGNKVEVASAYPNSYRGSRGIDRTIWVPMEKPFYDSLLEARDFRSPGMRAHHEERERRSAAMADPRLMGQRPRFDHQREGFKPVQVPPDDPRLDRASRASATIPFGPRSTCRKGP